MEEQIYKDAVIIGNGPSAITLSYLLSGVWPFYNGFSHPIDFLQKKLKENMSKSILEQDLKYLSEGLEGRSVNPVSVLFDTLTHPEADIGNDHPSVLFWAKNEEWEIDHVALGKGCPGGAWQKMDGSTLTLSLGSWMELPTVSIRNWDESINRLRFGPSGLRQKRATVDTVSKYYRYYVESQGLSKYFINDATVTSVSKVSRPVSSVNTYCQEVVYKVAGYKTDVHSNTKGKSFTYVTPNVILATGNSDQCNKLNVEGEDLPFVLYTLSELDDVINRGLLSSSSGKLLIVGAGLNAADAVIAAKFHGIPIIHAFRRSVYDPELIFNKLPQNIYPEYHKVHQMMQDNNQTHYEGYKAFPQYTVNSIKPDGTVTLMPCGSEGLPATIQVSHVLVLIGMHPNLSFLSDLSENIGIYPGKPVDCKKNPIDINLYTHESVYHSGLYAVGPLVGDNFVRFVQGGCLAVASHLNKKLKKCK